MGAGTFALYNSAREGLGDGVIDIDTHTFKCGFVSLGYTPADSHSLWSQVSTSEISASGYTAGGFTLTGLDYTATSSTKVKMTASAFTISGTGVKKVKWAVLYDTGSTPANRLLGYFDLETTSTTGIEATAITVSFPNNTVFQAS